VEKTATLMQTGISAFLTRLDNGTLDNEMTAVVSTQQAEQVRSRKELQDKQDAKLKAQVTRLRKAGSA
jgi:hypothetical protein